MKFVYLFLFLLLLSPIKIFAAEAPLIIGEFRGNGLGSLQVSDGRDKKLDCHIAYNFYNSREQFYMAYSLYQCIGLGAINDQTLQAVIRQGEIFSDSNIGPLPAGTKIGELTANGSFSFFVTFKQKQKVRNQIVNPVAGNCAKRSTQIEELEYELEYLHRFKVVPSENGFIIERELQKDFITADYKKNSECPNLLSLVFEKKTSRALISGSVEKFNR